ncbi:hypothetical protein Moror_13682 [Moniliophthora roreri MCA 2997]|uniref:Uncharacterized protein n=2 Tax=Moniliophthora roreri TaxID=221103 RepID=V2XC59_MONRO|nr:hypothetical protein Moror_13682 [Moniliophthora roreri MCA 2997]
MSTPGVCIAANPDVSGIGVRVAVYAQTFLSYAPAFLFTYDGKLDLEEEQALLKIYTPLLISSMALLITTGIQQVTIGLGNHHILLVLNLMWMMNASALVLCVVPTLEWLSRPQVLPVVHQKLARRWKMLSWFPSRSQERHLLFWWPRRHRQLLGVVFVSVHLMGMSVLGLWHWIRLNIRGLNSNLDPSECFDKITTTYLFMRFPITDDRIRVLSLVFYSFMAIPILNIEFAVMLVNGISWLIVSPGRRILNRVLPQTLRLLYTWFLLTAYGRDWPWLEPRLKCIVAVLLPLFIAVHTVIDTELTINRNTALVGNDEKQWTFGQVLALLLVILPLIQAISMFLTGTPIGKKIWRWSSNVRHGRKRVNVRWWMSGILLPSQPWSEIYKQVDEALHMSRTACADLRREIDQLDGLTLPCVAASAVFSIGSLLFIADQTLKITNETFTFPGHPPLVHPTISRPIFAGSPTDHLNAPKPEPPDFRATSEARVSLALKRLKRAITDARDNISIAQSVRFPDITEQSRYNAVVTHLKHLLAILDIALTTARSLSMSGACLLREEVNNWGHDVDYLYHICHFDYREAVGQISANMVYDLGGIPKDKENETVHSDVSSERELESDLGENFDGAED